MSRTHTHSLALFPCLYINLGDTHTHTHRKKDSLIFFCHVTQTWMHTHMYSVSLSHTHAHTDAHFNHFVSCQERNVSQPRSPLIPGVPSLICLSLCLPSGSSLPLSLLHSIPLSYMFCYTLSLSLTLTHTHTLTGLIQLPRLILSGSAAARGSGIAGMPVVSL